MVMESLHEVHDMSVDNGDELTRILITHREHLATARLAAQQRALNVRAFGTSAKRPFVW